MKKVKTSCALCGKEIDRIPTKTNTSFCDNHCKGQWQTLQRENLGFTKDWLVDQYFNQGKTCNDIAREIGRDAKRVWEWFKQYGIEVNKRGANWQKNLDITGSSWIGRKHKAESKVKIREARIRDGHVPYLKNGQHYMVGMKSEDHPSWKGGITPERQGVYSSLEWRDSVRQVWKRDNATCQRCRKHQNDYRETKFHIHHIESFMIKDLRCEVDNLVLLCPDCHHFVHSKENKKNEFLNTKKDD